jgi:hypothetical protein
LLAVYDVVAFAPSPVQGRAAASLAAPVSDNVLGDNGLDRTKCRRLYLDARRFSPSTAAV